MTREEAIRWLNQIKRSYIFGGDEGFDASRKEAIDMAIEALVLVSDAINALTSDEAEQVTGKLNNPDDSLLTADSEACKEQKSKLDLISRQDEIAEIKALYEWHDTVTEDRAVDHLKRLPSAEPKTGEWEFDPNGMDWNIPAWRCSECGYVATHIGIADKGIGSNPMNWAGSKYCPECGCKIVGARMKGEEE